MHAVHTLGHAIFHSPGNGIIAEAILAHILKLRRILGIFGLAHTAPEEGNCLAPGAFAVGLKMRGIYTGGDTLLGCPDYGIPVEAVVVHILEGLLFRCFIYAGVSAAGAGILVFSWGVIGRFLQHRPHIIVAQCVNNNRHCCTANGTGQHLLAACLEEHYPHSMANAVVEEAKLRNLRHEERHSKVEYVVAHGISSRVDGEKVVIGSHHFVFEDEGCVVLPEDQAKFDALPPQYSHLYLAVGGTLAAVICIEDPLRQEAKEVIAQLKELGLHKIVMMTGDSYRTAQAVAKEVGVTEFHAEVLPEDKAAFVRKEHEAGRKVIMIGDGVNDSPALSEADAGVSISTGAAIAREVADITISAEDLRCLVTMRKISDALMARIHGNYRFIISFNMMLIILGVAGILPPTTSALLHNMSTLGISLKSMTNLLE